jgi:putative hydrolase of the HAD superfamily
MTQPLTDQLQTITQVWFDFGQVCSQRQDRRPLSRIADHLEMTLTDLLAAYHEHRFGYDQGLLSAAQYWSRVAGYQPLAIDWLIAQDYASWNRKNHPLLAFVAELIARQVPVLLLSNMPFDFKRRLQIDWPELAAFSQCYFSCDLGFCKPDPAIYRWVLRDSGFSAEQSLFLDDMPANIEAAEQIGMHGVLFSDTAVALTAIAENYQIKGRN